MTTVRIAVRVRPGASRTRVGGRYGEDDPPVLGVSGTQRAVDGAATSRTKILEIRAASEDDAAAVQARWEELLGA